MSVGKELVWLPLQASILDNNSLVLLDLAVRHTDRASRSSLIVDLGLLGSGLRRHATILEIAFCPVLVGSWSGKSGSTLRDFSGKGKPHYQCQSSFAPVL